MLRIKYFVLYSLRLPVFTNGWRNSFSETLQSKRFAMSIATLRGNHKQGVVAYVQLVVRRYSLSIK